MHAAKAVAFPSHWCEVALPALRHTLPLILVHWAENKAADNDEHRTPPARVRRANEPPRVAFETIVRRARPPRSQLGALLVKEELAGRRKRMGAASVAAGIPVAGPLVFGLQ